ncbi:hypothetical protein FHS43_002298 [Streptosporangium becharense]|uniref:ParB-like N-terminal domain-containing protein n=1 Tax=Streptosporangium becharense TaxID=1816182 RepID=A0A7W9MIX3_9ACTN|nr:ParB N-terminal domain-containing protein [Streptosporangium becharense]MBB2911033.1 hypothetical protein [Streptosporangium becharense]MBB5821909.1 hypothetical protein [Streptosporangium becharense]
MTTKAANPTTANPTTAGLTAANPTTAGQSGTDVPRPVSPKAPGGSAGPVRRGCPGGPVARVPVAALREADSPRLGGLDRGHLRVLAEKVDELPPIVVHRPTMKVVDGMHRLHAARLSNRETVEVTYFEGSEKEAFVLAVEANVKHGLPLSLPDRKESARRILRNFPEWSDRAIAARVGLSNKTVGALRRDSAAHTAQPAVRVGRDGRVRPLSPAEGRLRACHILSRKPDAPLREIAESAGISVETARNVRERLSRGESPLPGGETPGEPGPRPGRPATGSQPVDLGAALDALKRDPAVRYTSEGRAMVRWLEGRIIRGREADLVMRAPAHQATKIAAMARAVAARWNEIAARLECRATGDAFPAS